MVETKKFYTRVQLKYDSWERWNSDENKVKVPLAGEVCLVAIPSTGVDGSVPSEAPAVLMKVGDGTTPFKDLKWLSAKAADVHSWAKMSESDFKAWLVSVDGPALATDADLDALDARVVIAENAISDHGTRLDNLEAALGTSEGEGDSIIERVGALEGEMDDAQEDILALEGLVGTKGDAASVDTAFGRIAKAQAAAEAAQGAANTNAGDIAVLEGSDKGKSVRTIATEAIASYAQPGVAEDAVNTLTEVLDWIKGVDDEHEGAAALIEDVSKIQTYLGEKEDGSYPAFSGGEATVPSAINGNYSRIEAAVARIATLEGMVGEEGSVTEAIANAEKAAKDYADTEIGKAKTELKGYADQAETDAVSAAKDYTDGKILEVNGTITTIQGQLGEGTVDSRIATALQSAKDYADESERDAVATVVGASTDASTANTINGAKKYASEQAIAEAGKVQAALNEAVGNIGTQLGEGTVDSRIEAAEDRAAEDATAKADKALEDAKAYADQAETDAISAANKHTDDAIAGVNGTIGTLSNRPFVSVENNGVVKNEDGSEEIHYVTFYCGSADVMF